MQNIAKIITPPDRRESYVSVPTVSNSFRKVLMNFLLGGGGCWVYLLWMVVLQLAHLPTAESKIAMDGKRFDDV